VASTLHELSALSTLSSARATSSSDSGAMPYSRCLAAARQPRALGAALDPDARQPDSALAARHALIASLADARLELQTCCRDPRGPYSAVAGRAGYLTCCRAASICENSGGEVWQRSGWPRAAREVRALAGRELRAALTCLLSDLRGGEAGGARLAACDQLSRSAALKPPLAEPSGCRLPLLHRHAARGACRAIG